MMDPLEDPRLPYRKRHEHARVILGKRYPGAHVQRVVTLHEGRRVEATVILTTGQSIEVTVPEVEVQWY